PRLVNNHQPQLGKQSLETLVEFGDIVWRFTSILVCGIMGYFSLLPEWASTIETWLVRLFWLLALLTFGPWLALMVYDLVLYLWRSATYELPVVGGRARGRARPRAPSLTERPDGHKRHLSLANVPPRLPSGFDGEAVTSGRKDPSTGSTVLRSSQMTHGEPL
ncbi:hypothetical protein Tdes44962_MAKER04101, partial [Teratosphaeria destructans]